MITFPIRPYLPALIHILVWTTLGVMLLVLQPLSWNIALPTQFWIMQGIIFCVFICLFYLNANVWVPHFLFKNKIWLFIFLALATSVGVFILLNMASKWLNLSELMYQATHANRPGSMRLHRREAGFDMGRHFFTSGMILLILFISTSVAAVQKWRLETKVRQDLEQEKISSELSFLKAQINPHFFFNTLNNIYSLTMFNVELAQKALHTLSRMMRYVLYDTQADSTLLSKELAFVQDYIDLMKLRLTDKVQVIFEQPASLADVPIAPMLLLPFIENAFKYGVSTDAPSHIYIGIKQQQNRLAVEVRNTIFTQKRVTLDESNGIGLVNTRRRLDLLYPNKYSLNITEKTPTDEYVICLVLNL
ncbi:sensor histidine kinase [Adhaeribacter rhizoryzae]|uniref:Sensor histidine kinase n=1 Tax=Adhaeribacter rhizoryzae TaxID=2607907 RepID=A0A5M6DJG1_9BACT|nr:histidine kinase [Adhaeribacter rhizoryzae]KAA5546380.1 sensor histidine kinase [Adhaeribacter rhizoryzae]